MDSLNQTALMNLENRIITDEGLHNQLGNLVIFTLVTMPIVVLVNYSNSILGFFELAASVSRKYIVERV